MEIIQPDRKKLGLSRGKIVIETVDDLRGWHVANCWIHKPGVYQMYISRNRFPRGAEMMQVFVKQKIVTTAIELGYLSRPSGKSMP